MIRSLICLMLGLGCAFGFHAIADDPKPPLQMADYNWEKDAHTWKLSDAEIATLKSRGFFVSDRAYKQVFMPYLDETQLFITSDCLTNAYSVLLEDSIRRLESVNARRLNAFLVDAWKSLDGIENVHKGDKAMLQAAAMRIRIMMGVALELSSGEKVHAPPTESKIIEEEVQRVIAASERSKPIWLGPPDDGFVAIDYSRFKPRGLYAGKPALERFFRATDWLQAIPFRFDRDDEFAAYLLLYVQTDYGDSAKRATIEGVETMVKSYDSLVGWEDDPGLVSSAHASWPETPWNAELLTKVRGIFDSDVHRVEPQINDQLASLSKDGKPERAFRILPARRLPDALLFSKTEELRQKLGVYPSGLEVAAALGSPTARKHFEGDRAALLKEIDANKELFGPGSLYNQFLDATATLLEPVDTAAPPLLRSPAWEEKSLQTFLGGWAQERHAWILQAKQNVSMIGGMSESVAPRSFVEPVPEFFNKMGHLALSSMQEFKDAGAYEDNITDTVADLRQAAAAYRRAIKAQKSNLKSKPSEEDLIAFGLADRWMIYLMDRRKGMDDSQTAPEFEKLADELETQGIGNDKYLRETLAVTDPPPEQQWIDFAKLCLELESEVHSELRGTPPTEHDGFAYQSFGERLAHLMLYGGNSFEMARDDAPKIADIYSDPNAGKFVHVGIGRPHLLFVLYPYQGKQILVHGAVLPYYEFAAGERLTDKAWADQLASPSAPAQPAWLGDLSGMPQHEDHDQK